MKVCSALGALLAILISGCQATSKSSKVKNLQVEHRTGGDYDDFYPVGDSLRSPRAICRRQCADDAGADKPATCTPPMGAVTLAALRQASLDPQEQELVDIILAPGIEKRTVAEINSSDPLTYQRFLERFTANLSNCNEQVASETDEGGADPGLNLVDDLPTPDLNNLYRNVIKLRNRASSFRRVRFRCYTKYVDGTWGWMRPRYYDFEAHEGAATLNNGNGGRLKCAAVFLISYDRHDRYNSELSKVFRRFYDNSTITINIGGNDDGSGGGGGGGSCVYNGRRYSLGDSFESTDGCNTCHCESRGVLCTERGCVGGDVTCRNIGGGRKSCRIYDCPQQYNMRYVGCRVDNSWECYRFNHGIRCNGRYGGSCESHCDGR